MTCMVVFSNLQGSRVSAVNLSDGSLVWRVSEVITWTIDPWGMASDSEGRLFVADGPSRLLVLHAQTGKLLQSPFDLERLNRGVWVCGSKLVMGHRGGGVSVCEVSLVFGNPTGSGTSVAPAPKRDVDQCSLQ